MARPQQTQSGEEASPNFEFSGSPLGDQDTPICTAFSCDYFGVVSGRVTRRRKEGPMPKSADWITVKSAPVFFNLPCMGVDRTYQAPWATYQYGYEGIIKSLGASDNITFEIDVTETEEPIPTHPNFPYLRQTYLWNPNTRRFPELIPGTGNDSDKLIKNPLSGVEAYLVPGAIFRMTAVTDSIPSDLWDQVGLASNLPKIPGFTFPGIYKRQWFQLGPTMRKRGNCVEYTKSWQMAGPNGINKDIYDKKWIWQYQDPNAAQGVQGSSGLTSGSL
jgi:hypothetical protein